MSNFDLEKIKEELSVYDPLMPCVVKALRVIGRLCEEGQKLERQRDWLAQKCEAFCLDSDIDNCPHCPFRNEETPCFLSDKESWIKFAEQAAKEEGK